MLSGILYKKQEDEKKLLTLFKVINPSLNIPDSEEVENTGVADELVEMTKGKYTKEQVEEMLENIPPIGQDFDQIMEVGNLETNG